MTAIICPHRNLGYRCMRSPGSGVIPPRSYADPCPDDVVACRDCGQNLESGPPNPSLGGRGNLGGDPVRGGGVAGSIPASATPPSDARQMCNDGDCPEWEFPHDEHGRNTSDVRENGSEVES